MAALIIDDPLELLALHMALSEARYHPEPERSEIQGSSILAHLHSRLYDALVDADGDGKNGWRGLRRLRHGSILYRRIEAIIARPGWSRMDAETKESYVRHLITPYEADDADVGVLIDYGNALHASDGPPRPDNPS